MKQICYCLTALLVLMFASCSDDDNKTTTTTLADAYANVTIDEAETYAGGVGGTVFHSGAYAYKQPAPACVEQGFSQDFTIGENFFEKSFTEDLSGAYPGLGPLYLRNSCLVCHPGYGHGKRMTRYRASDAGNGYLLVLYDLSDNSYLTSVTGMPQTVAVDPFKAPIDEDQITIDWLTYTDEWGNQFDDGETYELIYPEVTIPASAYYVPIKSKNGVLTVDQVGVRLEGTIGIYGTGLLSAIPEDSIKAQYILEEKNGITLNSSIWANGDWASYYTNSLTPDKKYIKRFTYALTRPNVCDGPGANAIWNITNVTRSDRMYHYMTTTYAETASQDPDVQAVFYNYFPEAEKYGSVEDDIYYYLMGTDPDGNKVADVEMTDEHYRQFMVWHRGMGVPAARDLDQNDVKMGRALFREIGCAECHRPSWTTGEDHIDDPNGMFTDDDLPRFSNQVIWPYTDMIQHRLFMENDIRTGWCRTTPLWGRGLSLICTGAEDRLHDCRARSTMEAIMWHGNANSDARWSIENFRKLSKEERDAVIAFVDAI